MEEPETFPIQHLNLIKYDNDFSKQLLDWQMIFHLSMALTSPLEKLANISKHVKSINVLILSLWPYEARAEWVTFAVSCLLRHSKFTYAILPKKASALRRCTAGVAAAKYAAARYTAILGGRASRSEC